MSKYSGGEIKTIILDPVSHINNVRSEFRLDIHDVITSDLRLTNIGVNQTGGTSKYGILAGSYGVIKHIYLMDGQTHLSSSKHSNLWLAWKNVNKSNAFNDSLGSVVNNSVLGYFIDETQNQISMNRTDRFTEIANNSGWLSLKDVLPLLGSISSLHRKLMPNLKLVIEYDADFAHFARDNTGDYTSKRPTLCVDVIQDEGIANNLMMNMPNNVVWTEIEHDEFVQPIVGVDATTTHKTQVITHKVNGFDNKTLNRLLISKSNQNPNNDLNASLSAVIGYGGMGSLAVNQFKTNYVVNYSPILTGKGVVGEGQRIAMLCDAWGNVNVPPTQNLIGSQGNADRYHNFVSKGGSLSYDGLFVGQRINQLELQFERTGIYNAGTQLQENNALRVHIWGEVSKSMVIKNGSYNLSYL